MSTMLFADEVVDPDSIDELAATADVEVTKRELDIAKQLVESLAGPFEPDKYHDTYREEVLDLIERKAAGEEIAVQPAAEEDEEPVPDLMAALKASLDAVRDKDADGNGGGQGEEGAGQGQGQVRRPSRKKALKQELAAGARRVRPPRGGRHRPSPAPRACAGPTAPAPASRAGATAAASASSTPTASRVDDAEVLRRIHELVIPPAWEDVWICPYPGGHIQATGVDAAGRKQYLYHPRWRERRDQEKFDDMVVFARTLPALRERVDAELAAATSSPTTTSARAPCACWTAASSASAARTTRCATRATAWRR